MPPFTIEMSSPMSSGFTKSLGGPNSGGHAPSNKDWYIRYGMDFGAPVDTEVRAAFSGHATVYHAHDKAKDKKKEYGAQIFVRSENNMMGGFYTHLTSVPATVRAGATISRGDVLGKVYVPSGGSPHLHWALVEIIGGAPGGRYSGVNLHKDFVSASNADTVLAVTFSQDGKPPVVA